MGPGLAGPSDHDLVADFRSGRSDCAAAVGDKRFGLQPLRWFVVVDEDDPTAKPAVLAEAGFGRACYSLPIVEVEAGDQLVERLRTIPGVSYLIPAMKAGPAIRSIADGIDIMASLALLHNRVVLGEGTYGGREQGDPPGYPYLEKDEDGDMAINYDTTIDWPAASAVMPVINMSLGTGPSNYPYQLNDIVNLATASASRRVLIVMAAGNCGELPDGEGMSAWAEAPWVLSVGATSDEGGTTLAHYSSRGSSDDPTSGPDVVAFGTSAFSDTMHGTSFAAPRVTGVAQLIAAALLQLGRSVELANGSASRGVPLVGSGIIDDFGGEMFFDFNPPIVTNALPILGPIHDNVVRIVRLAAAADISIDVLVSPSHLRDAVLRSARPMPRYEPHEVGAGFVSGDIAVAHLATLTGTDLIESYGSNEPNDELSQQLSTIPLFNPSDLNDLQTVVPRTAPMWKYDRKTARFGMIPKNPDELAALDPFEQQYGELIHWPPNQP